MYYAHGPRRPIILPEPTPEPTQIQEEELYWEKDDVNPNNVIYDLENNETIIPATEDEITVTPLPPVNKMIIKNVSNRKFRNNR